MVNLLTVNFIGALHQHSTIDSTFSSRVHELCQNSRLFSGICLYQLVSQWPRLAVKILEHICYGFGNFLNVTWFWWNMHDQCYYLLTASVCVTTCAVGICANVSWQLVHSIGRFVG